MKIQYIGVKKYRPEKRVYIFRNVERSAKNAQ